MEFDWKQITADFRQKYEETFIRVALKDNLPYEVFLVSKVNTGKPPSLKLINEKWGDLTVNYDTDLDVNFEYPEIGYFLYQGQATLVFKTYQRQWKRGICSSTLFFCFPYMEIVLHNYAFPLIQEALVTAAFLPRKLYQLSQINTMLNKGSTLSHPLSNSLALGLSLKENNKKLLWFLNKPVGEYNETKKTLVLNEPIIKQEIEDYLKQTDDSDVTIC